MDLGECSCFIGYPASTDVLYSVLYSWTIVFVLWTMYLRWYGCMLVFCGHVIISA